MSNIGFAMFHRTKKYYCCFWFTANSSTHAQAVWYTSC